jgi:hypothetical protein
MEQCCREGKKKISVFLEKNKNPTLSNRLVVQNPRKMHNPRRILCKDPLLHSCTTWSCIRAWNQSINQSTQASKQASTQSCHLLLPQICQEKKKHQRLTKKMLPGTHTNEGVKLPNAVAKF